jgi:hypothetical protein
MHFCTAQRVIFARKLLRSNKTLLGFASISGFNGIRSSGGRVFLEGHAGMRKRQSTGDARMRAPARRRSEATEALQGRDTLPGDFFHSEFRLWLAWFGKLG